MSARGLFRLTGAGVMVAAVLFAVGLATVEDPPGISVLPQLLIIGFASLLMAGVPGLYLRQRQEAGVLGLTGAAVIFFSTLLLTGFNFVGAFILPVLAEGAPQFLQTFPEGAWSRLLPLNVGLHLAFAVGWLLFGIATYRAAVLPRWAAVISVTGGIGQIGFVFVPRPVGVAIILLLAIGLFGLGRGLWASVTEPTGHLSHPRVAETP